MFLSFHMERQRERLQVHSSNKLRNPKFFEHCTTKSFSVSFIALAILKHELLEYDSKTCLNFSFFIFRS